MTPSARSKAEEKFSKIQQRDIEALKEREKADKASSEKTARLRALRVAKEEADKAAVDEALAAKAATKAKTAAAKTKAKTAAKTAARKAASAA